MTARGELFVKEVLRSLADKDIKEKVSDKYGKDTSWIINANHYSEIWSRGDLPKEVYGYVVIKLRNKQHRKVGKVHATLSFNVEGENSEKCIEPEIKKFSVEMFNKPMAYLC